MEMKFDFAYGSGAVPMTVKAGQIDVIESVTPAPIDDLKEAFRWSVAAATAAVMTEGTQLVIPQDVTALLERVVIQEV